MDFILLLILGASLAGNAVAVWLIRGFAKRQAAQLAADAAEHARRDKEYADELERLRKAPAPTVTAEQIIHDLTATGRALISIERINAADVFLRSPRT